jgi:hypothetical protein
MQVKGAPEKMAEIHSETLRFLAGFNVFEVSRRRNEPCME